MSDDGSPSQWNWNIGEKIRPKRFVIALTHKILALLSVSAVVGAITGSIALHKIIVIEANQNAILEQVNKQTHNKCID